MNFFFPGASRSGASQEPSNHPSCWVCMYRDNWPVDKLFTNYSFAAKCTCCVGVPVFIQHTESCCRPGKAASQFFCDFALSMSFFTINVTILIIPWVGNISDY